MNGKDTSLSTASRCIVGMTIKARLKNAAWPYQCNAPAKAGAVFCDAGGSETGDCVQCLGKIRGRTGQGLCVCSVLVALHTLADEVVDLAHHMVGNAVGPIFKGEGILGKEVAVLVVHLHGGSLQLNKAHGQSAFLELNTDAVDIEDGLFAVVGIAGKNTASGQGGMYDALVVIYLDAASSYAI